MKKSVTVELTWSEAANLVVAAQRCDVGAFTPAARGALERAIRKLLTETRLDDPCAFYIIVNGERVPIRPILNRRRMRAAKV